MKLKSVLLLFFLFVSARNVFSQIDFSIPDFGTPTYEAVNKWVVFENKSENLTHVFGFVYIDIEKGFSFKYYGELKVTESEFTFLEDENGQSSFTLQARDTKFGVLSNDQVEYLGLEKLPIWVTEYLQSFDEIYYLSEIGKLYSDVGAKELAIATLKKVYDSDPNNIEIGLELAKNLIDVELLDDGISLLVFLISKEKKT